MLNLKHEKNEKKETFKSKKLKPADKSDYDSYKTRRGKVGGYRDYFSEEQIEYINDVIFNNLNPVYGYQTD